MKKIILLIFFYSSSVIVNAQHGTCNGNCSTPCLSDNYDNPGLWLVDDAANYNGEISPNFGVMNYTAGEWNGFYYDIPHCSGGIRGCCNNRVMRAYRNIGATLSNTQWRSQCKINVANGNGPSVFIMALTAGTQDPQATVLSSPYDFSVCGGGPQFTSVNYTNQDGIFASLIAYGGSHTNPPYTNPPYDAPNNNNYPNSNTDKPFPGNGTGWAIYGHAKKGNTNNNGLNFWPVSTNGIDLGYLCLPQLNWSKGIQLPSINSNYWVRLERFDAGHCRISVFSNSAMTNHVPGSPQCFEIDPTIAGLNAIQHATYASGTVYRSIEMTADSLRIYNNCPDDYVSFTPQFPCFYMNTPACVTANVIPAPPTSPPTTYTWDTSPQINAQTACPTLTSNPMSYSVSITLPGGCPISGTFAVVSCSVNTKMANPSLGKENGNDPFEFELYPNPTSGICTLYSKNDLTGSEIQIVDYTGRLITVQYCEKPKLDLDVSGYAKGFYFVRIRKNDVIITRKLVKE